MPDAIHSTAAMVAMRQVQVAQGEIKPGAIDPPALDSGFRSRLLQLKLLVGSSSNASDRLKMLTSQLALERMGTLGPPTTEVLSDAVALEELNRKKYKEAELASALRKALHDSERTQSDLLRAFSFLMPQILLEDENSVGLPGFQTPMENPADLDAGGLIWNSHADFFAHISALLEVLKTEWLSKYQDALAKFLEFYQEFSDIMEKIKPEASGDKGDVKIDFAEAVEDLEKLMDKYGLDKNALASFSSRAEADAFVKSMGIPLSITESGDGKFHVKMDLSAVQDLVESMPVFIIPPGISFPVTWDSARYNAWVSAKDSNMEQIKHVSKVLGEKLNEMTQKFDNIVKILSSSIDKMSEANMAYVHNT